MKVKQIKKAVIPAAGYGTRFLPITKTIPKEMLPIIDKPALEYIIDEAIASGISEIIIIISSNKTSIMQYFDRNLELEKILEDKSKNIELGIIKNIAKDANIFYVSQKEQLGLGHAILQAKHFIGEEDFAVLLGDDVYVGQTKPALAQLIDAYSQKQATILGTQHVADSETHKYGICIPKVNKDTNQIIELQGVVEKPKVAPSNSAISGRYILTSTIFKYLENQERGAGNEIQLTDAILRMMTEEPVYSFDMIGSRYDIGAKIGYIEAILDFGLEREDLKTEIRELIFKKAQKLE